MNRVSDSSWLRHAAPQTPNSSHRNCNRETAPMPERFIVPETSIGTLHVYVKHIVY